MCTCGPWGTASECNLGAAAASTWGSKAGCELEVTLGDRQEVWWGVRCFQEPLVYFPSSVGLSEPPRLVQAGSAWAEGTGLEGPGVSGRFLKTDLVPSPKPRPGSPSPSPRQWRGRECQSCRWSLCPNPIPQNRPCWKTSGTDGQCSFGWEKGLDCMLLREIRIEAGGRPRACSELTSAAA